MIESVSISYLKNNQLKNIIDIRSIQKYNDGHIYNAKNIPYNDLIMNHYKYLNKEEKYYIYCQRGIQSKKTCQVLNALGYHVINVDGGYEAWILSE